MWEFCKLHSYRMRAGSTLPNHVENAASHPVRAAAMYFLTSCGATVPKINMTRTEKQARKFYKLVLAEMVKSTTQQ